MLRRIIRIVMDLLNGHGHLLRDAGFVTTQFRRIRFTSSTTVSVKMDKDHGVTSLSPQDIRNIRASASFYTQRRSLLNSIINGMYNGSQTCVLWAIHIAVKHQQPKLISIESKFIKPKKIPKSLGRRFYYVSPFYIAGVFNKIFKFL